MCIKAKSPIFICLFSLVLSLCGSAFPLSVSAEEDQDIFTVEEFSKYISNENNQRKIKKLIESELNIHPMIQQFDTSVSLGEPKQMACYHPKTGLIHYKSNKQIICGIYMNDLLIGYLEFYKGAGCNNFVLFSDEVTDNTKNDLVIFYMNSYDNGDEHSNFVWGEDDDEDINVVSDSGFVRPVYGKSPTSSYLYDKYNSSDSEFNAKYKLWGKDLYEKSDSEYHIPKTTKYYVAEIDNLDIDISSEDCRYIVNASTNNEEKHYLTYSDGKYVLSDEISDDDSQLFTFSCDEDGNIAIRNKKSGKRIGVKNNFDLTVYYNNGGDWESQDIDYDLYFICVRLDDVTYALTKKDDGSVGFSKYCGYYCDYQADPDQMWYFEKAE